jgi:hypothetical protein
MTREDVIEYYKSIYGREPSEEEIQAELNRDTEKHEGESSEREIMKEQIAEWLKQFEADNQRKPTVQEFQDAKKTIELRIDTARMRDTDVDIEHKESNAELEPEKQNQQEIIKSELQKRKQPSPKRHKLALFIGVIVILIAIIAAILTIGRLQEQSSQTVTSSSSKEAAMSKATKKDVKVNSESKKEQAKKDSESKASSESVEAATESSESAEANKVSYNKLDKGDRVKEIVYYIAAHSSYWNQQGVTTKVLLDDGVDVEFLDADGKHSDIFQLNLKHSPVAGHSAFQLWHNNNVGDKAVNGVRWGEYTDSDQFAYNRSEEPEANFSQIDNWMNQNGGLEIIEKMTDVSTNGDFTYKDLSNSSEKDPANDSAWDE